MNFNGFTRTDFDTFAIDGLEPRMAAIRERIQPKFKALGDDLCDEVALMAGNEMFLHIAKHLRRKTNPPKDTWLAMCHNKRGYKQHPHFQIGLFDDHAFLWLAFIYELPDKQAIAQTFLNHADEFRRVVPNRYLLSFDHMKKDAVPMSSLDDKALQEAFIRFRDVKKAELLIGRHVQANDPLLSDGTQFVQFAKETFETLMPIYKMAMNR